MPQHLSIHARINRFGCHPTRLAIKGLAKLSRDWHHFAVALVSPGPPCRRDPAPRIWIFYNRLEDVLVLQKELETT